MELIKFHLKPLSSGTSKFIEIMKETIKFTKTVGSILLKAQFERKGNEKKTVGNNVHIQNLSDLEMRITSGDDKQKAETTKLRIRLFWNPLNDNWSYSTFMRSIIPAELETFKSPRVEIMAEIFPV